MINKESFMLLTSAEIGMKMAQRCKHLRVNTLKMSQKDFAKRAGLSYATFQKFEQKGSIGLHDFLTIVSYLGRVAELEDLLLPPDIEDLGIANHSKQTTKKRAGNYR